MTGPSGSGKTTLLTLIGTLRTVMEGSLHVLGQQLRGASQHELASCRDIGFIFKLTTSRLAYRHANVRMA
jgi:putative ABC transport system ATP-binding protein